MDWLVVHVLLAAQPPVKVRLSTFPVWYISIHSDLKYARHVPCWSKPTRGIGPTLARHSSAADGALMSSTQSWVVIVAQLIHSCRLGQGLAVLVLTKVHLQTTRWRTKYFNILSKYHNCNDNYSNRILLCSCITCAFNSVEGNSIQRGQCKVD